MTHITSASLFLTILKLCITFDVRKNVKSILCSVYMSHCNESTPVETTPQTTKQGTYSGSVEGTHHRLNGDVCQWEWRGKSKAGFEFCVMSHSLVDVVKISPFYIRVKPCNQINI